MKIGLLVCGDFSPDMDEKFQCGYEDFFINALRRVDPTLSFQSFAVFDNHFPKSIDECDAWLITGSKNGVYENLPWMQRLQSFIRECYAGERALVGICFGHQIMAAALGGAVEKSDKGWGLGCQSYKMQADIPYLQVDQVHLYAIHQDQVIKVPEEAQVFMGNLHCPNAGLLYKGRAISFQPHPEFSAELERFLIERNIDEAFSQDIADAALKSLDGASLHNEEVFKLIVSFLFPRKGTPQ